jgi:hypothetical protein
VEGTANILGRTGYNVQIRIYEDEDHYVILSQQEAVLDDLARFIAESIPGTSSADCRGTARHDIRSYRQFSRAVVEHQPEGVDTMGCEQGSRFSRSFTSRDTSFALEFPRNGRVAYCSQTAGGCRN